MRRAFLVSLLFLSIGLVIGSRFYPTVEHVDIFGNVHFSPNEVMELARVSPGDPFFWITKSRLEQLAENPWIRSVYVYKRWPTTVSLIVEERTPSLSDGTTTYALDGTALPAPRPEELAGLTRIEGFGEERFAEAVELAQVLAEFGPEVLSYSPAGFTIQLANREVFTPSVESLKANWASLQAGFERQEGTQFAVYPWGVSATHD